MLKRLTVILFLLLLISHPKVRAQWDPIISNYWEVKSFYNPAFAGETTPRIESVYRYQWTGIKQAPVIAIATADIPIEFIGKNHGLGVVIFSENFAQRRNTLLGFQYAFRHKIGEKSLAVGLQGSIYNLKFDAGSIRPTSSSANKNTYAIKANLIDKKTPDLNIGISYGGERSYIGLSALHLLRPWFYAQVDSAHSTELHSDSVRLRIPCSYNFIAAYNIPLFHSLEIQPLIWIQSDFAEMQAQASLRITYNKKFWGGASWVRNDGYVFFAGTVIHGLEAGYAYNNHRKGIGKGSNGSHEIYFKYNFSSDQLFKEKKSPHKSVRIL